MKMRNNYKYNSQPSMMVQAFHPNIWETEASGSLSLKSVWSTYQVSGQPKLQRDAASKNIYYPQI